MYGGNGGGTLTRSGNSNYQHHHNNYHNGNGTSPRNRSPSFLSYHHYSLAGGDPSQNVMSTELERLWYDEVLLEEQEGNPIERRTQTQI